MAFGFPAYHEERVRYDCSRNDLMDAALDALDELGWGGRETGRWRITGSTGINLWSWGEGITIDIDSGPVLYVRSQCSFPTQWFDWGRNAHNVRRFLNLLDDVLDDFEREDRSRSRDNHDSDKPSTSRHVSDRPRTPAPPSSPRPRPGPGDDSIRR